MPVKAKTSSSTSKLKAKTSPYANSAGAESLNKTGNGEMESFSANSARSYIGKNVNLHLKDGAVIVNVQLTKIHKAAGKNNNLIEYTLANRKGSRIPLRAIAYAENLNVNLMQTSA